MTYSFKYSLSVEEYKEFAAYASWYAPWLKKLRIRTLFTICIYSAIMMAATIIVLNTINPSKNENIGLLIIISSIALLIAIAFSYYRTPYRVMEKAQKLITKEENAKLLAERDVVLNDSELQITNAGSNSVIKWDSIVKFAVTKKYFLLFINSEQAYLIPKRLMASQAEIDELDKFLTEKIPIAASFRSLGY